VGIEIPCRSQKPGMVGSRSPLTVIPPQLALLCAHHTGSRKALGDFKSGIIASLSDAAKDDECFCQ
jgi:hypothetical protein